MWPPLTEVAPATFWSSSVVCATTPALAPLAAMPTWPFLAMTLFLMLTMFWLAPAIAMIPFAVLLLTSLSVTSRLIRPFVKSVLMPPPLLPVTVT